MGCSPFAYSDVLFEEGLFNSELFDDLAFLAGFVECQNISRLVWEFGKIVIQQVLTGRFGGAQRGGKIRFLYLSSHTLKENSS